MYKLHICLRKHRSQHRSQQLSQEHLNFDYSTGSASEKHTKLNQCWFNTVPASQLNGEHDTRERYDGTYGTHRLHATK